jgi:hypothetical protein
MQEERRRVLRKCLTRINKEVMDSAKQGVAVRWVLCNMLLYDLIVSYMLLLYCSFCNLTANNRWCM